MTELHLFECDGVGKVKFSEDYNVTSFPTLLSFIITTGLIITIQLFYYTLEQMQKNAFSVFITNTLIIKTTQAVKSRAALMRQSCY